MNYYKVVVLLCIHANIFSQKDYIVIDSSSKEPLPYVNIWVLNKDFGTISKNNGVFSLPVLKDNDSIVFSAVGFRKKTIPKKNIDSIIPMISIPTELNEIVLIQKTKEKSIQIDRINKSIIKHYLPGFDNPLIFAKYFEFDPIYKETPFIEEIRLAVDATTYNTNFSIRIYGKNENGEPYGYIYNKPIIVKPKKGNRLIKVNLLEEKIIFPETGIFVAVEWLSSAENKSFFNSKEPNIGFIHQDTNKNSWVYKNGRWDKVNPYNGYVFSKNKFKELAVQLNLSN